MGLLISRNGTIGDYSRPSGQTQYSSSKKVSSKLEQERSQQREDQEKPQERTNKGPYQKAINSYKDQKSENHRAKSIASHSPITIDVDATVQEAIDLMKKYKIHHLLFVTNEKSIRGILSDRDILDKRRTENAFKYATKEVIVAREITDIKIICSLMIDKLVSAVPLVDEKGQLTGIITKTDILEFAFRSQHLEIYV